MRPLCAAGLLVLMVACGGGDVRVIVAAGTTLVDSGVIDEVVEVFEQGHPGVNVSVVGESTARVLDLGRRRAAEVLITHAPAAEATLVAEGDAARYEVLMESRFVLVGPSDRAALLSGDTPEQAFARIAAEGWAFVTRADGSGTEAAERAIWRATAIDPDTEPWYFATGLGMGDTLQVADQRGAFTLAEEGSFLAGASLLTVVAVATSPSSLMVNPYHVTLMRGASQEAGRFVEWLLSVEGRAAIAAANRHRFGSQVYVVP